MTARPPVCLCFIMIGGWLMSEKCSTAETTVNLDSGFLLSPCIFLDVKKDIGGKLFKKADMGQKEKPPHFHRYVINRLDIDSSRHLPHASSHELPGKSGATFARAALYLPDAISFLLPISFLSNRILCVSSAYLEPSSFNFPEDQDKAATTKTNFL